MYLKLIFLLMMISVLLNADIYTRTKVEMGTFITISLDEKYKEYIEDGFEILSDLNLALSSYNKNATIYKLNHQREIKIDSYTYQALNLSRYYYERTRGYFDISIGSITKDLYRFGQVQRVPSKKEKEDAKVNFNGIHFDRFKASLENGVKVDLGGMGKGFGVDKVASYYINRDIKKGIIAASGDIRCLSTCSIDVQDPFSDKTLASFRTKKNNSSISTSGNYNRYVDSLKHNHLINPKTKESQNRFISITLISSLTNSDIDAYATASSVMPLKQAYKFLDSLKLAYIVLQSDGELVISKNIYKYSDDLLVNYTKK
ncbi:MAG: FAD:protein FMN transferase [Campylobacterota bacterium]|nr:FAD:protein FMN transferase [Campylobacterota bacterium]